MGQAFYYKMRQFYYKMWHILQNEIIIRKFAGILFLYNNR